jgi:2-oxoglutarate ferredoxin oxidoreductase subunit gamma
MEEKIFIAGFGGQGVVLAGNVLAYAALREGKNILGMVSYGAEMRGGASNSSVIISDEEIDSPIIDKSTITIVLSQEAYDKFHSKTKKGGFLFINSSEVKQDKKAEGVKTFEIPATETAKDMGNVKVANLVLVGAVIEKTGILNKESVMATLSKVFSGKRKNLIYINECAIKKGIELAKGL